jgi:phosphatidylglycerophosphatase A
MKDIPKHHLPAFIISTGLGSGLSPKAPGTVGSAAAVIFLFTFWHQLHLGWRIGTALGLLVIGTVAVRRLLRGPYKNSTSDPQEFVIDEWCGISIAMLAMGGSSLLEAGVVFGLFRLFDIWKPIPISSLEKLPGAWGIMLDDIGAGVAALIVHILLVRALPNLLPALAYFGAG